MRGTRPSGPLAGDAGMTLVEVIVAMTIFALFAAAFAPIMLQGLVFAQRNAVQVTANQTAAEIVDALVVQSTCAGLAARADDWDAGVAAHSGERLEVDVTVAPCPTSFPATVHVAVSVTGASSAATAETLVLVQGG